MQQQITPAQGAKSKGAEVHQDGGDEVTVVGTLQLPPGLSEIHFPQKEEEESHGHYNSQPRSGGSKASVQVSHTPARPGYLPSRSN